MASTGTFTLSGQVVDASQNILDTLSQLQLALTMPDDAVGRGNETADNATEADLTLPSTSCYVFIWNRDTDNDLLIGPKVTGSLVRLSQIPPGQWAFFPIDATATLRYKSLVAPVDFIWRAWVY